MPRRLKTVAVPRADSRLYLDKAEQFVTEARSALEGSRNHAAMLNAIHAEQRLPAPEAPVPLPILVGPAPVAGVDLDDTSRLWGLG